MLRKPAVAGRFYPNDPRELEERVRRFVAEAEPAQPRSAIACMVPHAGYVFSGAVAGAVYGQLKFPRSVIVLGPRHRPRGADLAINIEGAWQTPLGRAEIDAELAGALAAEFTSLENDEVAHRIEHSLEVQIPFLQALAPENKFVPIAIGTLDFDVLTEMGHAIARVIKKSGEPILLICSSDMNHYESDAITRVKDHLAIEQLLALNPRGLYDVVRAKRITMCGCGPAISTLTAAIDLGASRADLVRYATSGDVLGDRDEVVGYAGMIFR
jgi:MEMO1 family protein